MAFNKVANENSKIATVDPIRSKQDIHNMCDWFIVRDGRNMLFYSGLV